MSASKRPSTSSLRRFITSRPYVRVAEIRRRFCLADPEAISRLACNGTSAFVGLPEREAGKLQDLWQRGEIGVELSVEVRAPVVVGVYPIRIARYVIDQANGTSARPEEAPAVPTDGWTSNGQPRGEAAGSPAGERRLRRLGRRRHRPEGQYAAE